MKFLKLLLPITVFALAPSTTQCMLASARRLVTAPMARTASTTPVSTLLQQYEKITDAATETQTKLIWKLLAATTEGEKAAIRYQMEKAQNTIVCHAKHLAEAHTSDQII